jgi:hypothetical protein
MTSGTFRNHQKEKQKLKNICRLLRRRKHMKKATRNLESHFKNLKKENQKFKVFVDY